MSSPYPREVETERLLLRPFRQSDFGVYAEMMADREVVRFLGEAEPAPRDVAWRHLAMLAGHWQLKGFGHWAVEIKQTGAFIGRVGLWFPEGWPDYEVGWVIARDAWGHGYAVEAARPALHHAFNTLDLRHVISLIIPGNVRSIRVSEKLGGRLERRAEFHGRETLFYAYDPAS
ncbi:MAG: GNAT family N-acetyltransferase [Candidatus Dormibacteria bacterium]